VGCQWDPLPLLSWAESPAPLQPIAPTEMANAHPGTPKQLDSLPREETAEENKKLLAKIDSKSLLLAPDIKGSIYFYIQTHDADNQIKEELIDDPYALSFARDNPGINIIIEDKHHRWVAQIPQALKILETATAYLKQKNNISTSNFGVNAELKWRDEGDKETIIHLSRSKDNTEWQDSRHN
jgi:hypothetical protein